MLRTYTSLDYLVHSLCVRCIQSDLHPWIKVNYLIELGEWLYQHGKFSLQDALDQFQLAVHILLRLREKPEGEGRSL